MPTADLLAWADKQALSGAFGVNPATTTEGVPAVGWYIGKLDVNAGAKKITLTESNGAYRTWTNTTNAGQWTKWVLQATATPPQEFDLPLESAFQNFLQERSVYRKDQFGVVNLDISVQPVSEIAVDTVIAYLPEGFRPAKNKRAAAIAVTPENECIAFPLFVGTSGMVSIAFFSAQSAQYKAIIGQIEFVAAG